MQFLPSIERKVAQRDWVLFPWSRGWFESELRSELRFFHAWPLQVCPWRLVVSLGAHKFSELF